MTAVADGAVAEAGVAPGAGESQTQVKPEVFTKEQVEKAVRDAKTAVLADAGRLKTEAEKAMRAAQAAQARLDQLEKEREAAELEAAKDDPERLTAIQERQRRRQVESELVQVKSELNDWKAKGAEQEQRQAEERKSAVAREVATRLKVDPAKLIKLSKFTDGSAEAIEDIAKELPRVSQGGASFRPDSNRSDGGGSRTVQDIRKDYIAGKLSPVQYEEQLKALNARP